MNDYQKGSREWIYEKKTHTYTHMEHMHLRTLAWKGALTPNMTRTCLQIDTQSSCGGLRTICDNSRGPNCGQTWGAPRVMPFQRDIPSQSRSKLAYLLLWLTESQQTWWKCLKWLRFIFHFSLQYPTVLPGFSSCSWLHYVSPKRTSQRCDWWYFCGFRNGITSVCVCVCVSLCVRVCTWETLPWSPNIPKWHRSHNLAQKTRRHILSALLRTTLRSPMNGCRRVNVELKTIKMNFMGQRNLWGNRSSFRRPECVWFLSKSIYFLSYFLFYSMTSPRMLWSGAPGRVNNDESRINWPVSWIIKGRTPLKGGMQRPKTI